MPEEQHDWSAVVALDPKGYVELNNGKVAVHGPLDSIEVDGMDFVVITLKWQAQIPLGGPMGTPTAAEWTAVKDPQPFRMPNFVMPFVVEQTPEKGPRVRFGLNIMYLTTFLDLIRLGLSGLTCRKLDLHAMSATKRTPLV